MKIKTTKKEIKNSAGAIIKLGYCKLQNLLHYAEPFAYSGGIYGWSCDYYNIDGVIISTGYGPIGEEVNGDLVREYESKEISRELQYEERQKQGLKLLTEFVRKATNELYERSKKYEKIQSSYI